MKKVFSLLVIIMVFYACEKDNSLSQVYIPEMYPVEVDGKWGYINAEGDMVLEPQFDYAYGFKFGLAAVRIDNHWGFMGDDGKMKIEPRFFQVGAFTADGLALAKTQDGVGYINRDGDIVIDCQYWKGREFSDGMAIVKDGYDYAAINTNGELIIPAEYSYITDFSDGHAWIQLESYTRGKWTIVNRNGEQVTDRSYYPCTYKEERPGGYNTITTLPHFSEGTATVQIYGKNCYVDTDGYVVLETSFDFISAFHSGMAFVGKDDNFGFINKRGTLLYDSYGFDFFSFFEGEYAPVKNHNEKWGIIDKNNRTVVSFDYKVCLNFEGDLAVVWFYDGNWGYVNKSDEVVWKSDSEGTYIPANHDDNPNVSDKKSFGQYKKELSL